MSAHPQPQERIDIIGRMDEALGRSFPDPEQAGVRQQLAGNVIEWCEQPGYLFTKDGLDAGRSAKTGKFLYPEAYKILTDVFDLLCPYCNEIRGIAEKKASDRDPDDEILLRHGRCPVCTVTYLDILRARRAEDYEELALAIGMGSGKTYLAAEVATYQVHVLLGLSSVRRTYGLAHGAPVEIAFVASTAEQTKKTIWAYFKAFMQDSPWFQDWLEGQRRIEKDQGVKLVDLNENDFKFHGPGFTCVSLNSNSGGLAGLRRIGGFLDELARFDLDGKRGANEVHQVIKASMQTFRNCYGRMVERGILPPIRPLLCSISSPIHEDDKIMRLGREARDVPGSGVYFRQLATWQFNPDYDEAHFAKEFDKDPARASRDYGAKPIGINERLIKEPDAIERCVNPRRRPILEYEEQFFAEAGHLYVRPVLKNCVPDRLIPRYIAIDPGLTRDSFGIAIGHIDHTPDGYGYKIVFDAIIEIRPVPGGDGHARREVHFESVTEFLLEIRRSLYIAGMTTDHWNSAAMIQRIRSTGLRVDRQNVTFDEWELFGGDVIAGRCEFPARERAEYNEREREAPVTKALHELRQMEYPNAKRVDHPEGGSSDLAICLAGVHRLATQGMFDDGSRPRRAQMPVGHGLHISQVNRIPKSRRIGASFRFRRM